jgi:hypothetical protein
MKKLTFLLILIIPLLTKAQVALDSTSRNKIYLRKLFFPTYCSGGISNPMAAFKTTRFVSAPLKTPRPDDQRLRLPYYTMPYHSTEGALKISNFPVGSYSVGVDLSELWQAAK